MIRGNNEYKKLLESYSKELGVNFIDTSKTIELLGIDGYAIKGPHLSPQANQVVAEQLSKQLFSD